MPGIAIIGSQFGDEGKGKVTDFYADKADIVARYQGGNNAGHTVVVKGEVIKLHHIPSGVMRGKQIVMGAGVIIDPPVLKKEIEGLKVKVDVNLMIDPRCHIIMPWHRARDIAMETASGKGKIGTTGRGIGPCYADKAYRNGIRFEDFVDARKLEERIRNAYPLQKKIIEQAFGSKFEEDAGKIVEDYCSLSAEFKKYLGDVSLEVHTALDKGKTVIFEGAQGTFLDLNFGTYPYVTSSNPISGSAAVGVGIAPNRIGSIVAITKAYTTRVGEGPFPTELFEEEGNALREAGKEYGTTTGRPRRVGWFDIAMMRTSTRLNGYTEIAITKLDVLSGMEKVKVCTHYDINGKKVDFWPYSTEGVAKAKPAYKEFDGFKITGKEREYSGLDANARKYLEFIEKELKVPIKLVSIGADREETILK